MDKHGINILRKTTEGYLNSFDNIIFDKIFFKQSIFISDRSTLNMQFSKMQNKIYGSLITIQCNTKCTNPHYPKFTSKKISVLFSPQQLTGHCLCSNSNHRKVFTLIFTVIAPNNVTFLRQKYTDMAYPGQYDSKLKVKH